MKNLFLFVIAAFLLIPAFAQDKTAEDFEWGIKFGMTVATQNYPGRGVGTDSDIRQLIGPTAGFIFEIPINSWFEIRPELLYGTQGRRWKGDVPGGRYVQVENFGYLQIPVLAKFKHGNEKVTGFVNIGPQFGVALFGVDRFRFIPDNGEVQKERSSINFEATERRRFDAGLDFGLGMECNKTGIEVEARYYLGLADVWDIPVKATNRSFTLALGWKF